MMDPSVSNNSPLTLTSVIVTTLTLGFTTFAAHRYYKVAKERKRLGNFPSSSPWFLPFADILHIIRAGTFEQFVTNRKNALKADAFYIHLIGFTQRPTLVLTKPEDFTELMKKEGKLELIVDMPDTIDATHGPGSIQNISGARHNFLRKILASLLHPAALESFVPYFYDAFTKMWAELDDSNDKVVIQDAICKAQFYLMAKILYGMTPENTSVEVLMQLRDDFEVQLKGHFANPKSDTFRKAKEASQRIRKILNPKFDAVLEKRRRMLEEARGKGGEEKKGDDSETRSHVGNAMESIADALLKDNSHTDSQILSDVYDNLNLLLEASHGTTMTVTTSTLYYLNHPDNASKLLKLREETKAFGNELPTLANLKNDMPIADGAIKEAMRLAPISGSVTYASKESVAFTFKGQKLQGPMSFFLAFAHNYSDARYYPEPDAFIPERWIPGSKEEVSKEGSLAYKPFGMGRHLCLGYNLALLVMKSSLYCFARDPTRAIEFDTETVTRTADIFPAYSISDGFPCKVVKKEE